MAGLTNLSWHLTSQSTPASHGIAFRSLVTKCERYYGRVRWLLQSGQNTPEKRTTLQGIPKFSDNSYQEFPFHFTFFSQWLQFSVEWFAFRKSSNSHFSQDIPQVVAQHYKHGNIVPSTHKQETCDNLLSKLINMLCQNSSFIRYWMWDCATVRKISLQKTYSFTCL